MQMKNWKPDSLWDLVKNHTAGHRKLGLEVESLIPRRGQRADRRRKETDGVDGFA